MATLAYQQVAIAGTALTLAAASAGGDKLPPGGTLVVRNSSVASINVTIAVPGNTKYGLANPDLVVAVAAAAEKLIGPLPQDLADPIDGLVAVTYSAVTDVTVGAFTI